MATLDLQEQEQIEELKSWWKDNRNFVLGTVLMIIIVMSGWRGWNYYQNDQAMSAAILYGEFSKQLEGSDAARVNDAATAVMDKYAGSIYASRAALLAAYVNVQEKDTVRATAQLQWVIDHGSEEELRDVARLRLAALFLDEGKFSDATKLLDSKHTSTFDGLYGDLRGDVLSAEGKSEEAISAYKLAIEKTDSNSMYRNLIQMKLDALVTAK